MPPFLRLSVNICLGGIAVLKDYVAAPTTFRDFVREDRRLCCENAERHGLNEVSAAATDAIEIRIDEKAHISADGTLVLAIKGLSLDIAYHSMTVLMGPSGCGKTTLLRLIAGLDKKFVGKATLPDGTRIGFMFQEPRLLPWRTVRQNIELVADPKEDVDALAEAVGITDKLTHYPQELSLGLARRVALARAFSTRPAVLLLDEPFVSLDERTADRLRRLLLEVWSARPTTAILVTHNPREAILLADQLVLLAPRPTHVVATVPIYVPRVNRDRKSVERIYAEMRQRSPESFPPD